MSINIDENKDIIYWGNGDIKLKNNQKKHKVVFGFPKKGIQKLYYHGDATIYISQGEVYKEGKLCFEPNYRKDDKKIYDKELIILRNSSMAMNVQIVDLSFGFNHVLLLSNQGLIFSWGDNYFGQLGLGSAVLPILYEPQLITKLEPVMSVLAFENNSFAITTSKKLYTWGSSKLLGNGIKSNLFRPFLMNSTYLFHKIKANNQTIISKVTRIVEAPEIKQEAIIIDIQKPIVEKNKDDEIDDHDEQKNFSNIKEISKILTEYNINHNDFYNKFIDEFVLNSSLSLNNKIFEAYWNAVVEISEKENFRIANSDIKDHFSISTFDKIELFALIIQSLIKYHLNNFKFDEILINYTKIEKHLIRGLYELDKVNIIDETVYKFNVNAKILLKRSAFIEKTKMQCCFIQALVILIKAFDFNNLITYSTKILNDNEDISRKINLIEKIYECCRFLYESLQMKVTTFVNLVKNKSDVNSEENLFEVLTNKLFIEGVKNLMEVWSLKVLSYQSYKIMNQKAIQIDAVYKVYTKLYGIHQYLNNIKEDKILLKYNYVNEINEKEDKSLGNYLIEIENVISSLEKTITLRKDNIECTDNYSNELVIMYSSSLLEISYMRKIINNLSQFKVLKSVIEA